MKSALWFGRPFTWLAWLIALSVASSAVVLRADVLDDTITTLIAKRHIPGLSLAIIQNGAIVKAKGYGIVEVGSTIPVTTDTLFQAGSVSKSVAAVGALALVDAGRLSLDSDVNGALKTWHVPDNAFTKENKVTLRRLLSHSAGLTVHGFAGYAVGVPRPTLVQILDGEKPANTEAVRVDQTPGSQSRYSGGGYTVMQQLLVDATGQTFPDFMRTQVLVPFGMRASSFEQPLPPDRAALAASGHNPSQPSNVVPGRRLVYPEMAAAGLWSTPSDLARFVIALQDTYAGRIHPVISSAMAGQMMSVQNGNAGLGVFLSGDGEYRRFEHGGRNEGFDTQMTAYLKSGQGAVIMINANDNSMTVAEIMEKIAEVYDWKNYPRMADNPEPEVTEPIEDKEPELTERLPTVVEQLQSGDLNREWFTAKFVESISSLSSRAGRIQSFGELKSISLIERKQNPDGHRVYRHRLLYTKYTVVIQSSYDEQGKIEGLFFQAQ
jgi:CubicO group peptidase (beta-lactamase class C family)